MKLLNTYSLGKAFLMGALVSLGSWMGATAPASAEISLTFGTYAADKPTETVRKYRPFLSFLEQQLSEELNDTVVIKMVIAKEYEDSIEQLATGVVDFARFGPAPYVLASEQNPNIQIVAMESKNGKKRFKGIIAVHNDSPIASIQDLAGQTFAFGDELSTIGRYLSQSLLLTSGITGADLQSYEFLGRHDMVGMAVGSKRFTAGALKDSTFKKLVKNGVPIRALQTFDNVTKPWLASGDLSADIVAAMRKIMLDEKNAEFVRKVAKNGFLEGTDADYQLIRDAMEQSRAF